LIYKAKDEIINNVKMIFEYPDFDNVIVDLSGGFDTRMVYAACTVLPDSLIRPKIKIFSRYSPTQNDLQVAISLNSVYRYDCLKKEDNANFKLIPLSSENADMLTANNISKSLGTYKEWRCWYLNEGYIIKNAAQIYGGCGDILHPVTAKTALQANDYINNRNRFHFRQPFNNSYAALMTKSGIKAAQLFHLKYDHPLWNKVAIDIMTLINPVCTVLPYANSSIIDFFNDQSNIEKLYKFPACEINFSEKSAMEYLPFSPPTMQETNAKAIIYDTENIKIIYERLRKITEFDKIVSEKLNEILKGPVQTTFTFRWWSLYWVLEIINGRGDFYENSHYIEGT